MARRVLVTDADDFLGPACVARFESLGDDVTAHAEPLTGRSQVEALVADHGPFDVVVANLDVPVAVAEAADVTDEQVSEAWDRLVRPLGWLLSACLPPMVTAGEGAVVVPTSATALRHARLPIATYAAARNAQTEMARSAALEVARHGVRVNVVAPNYIENPSYYPPELVADERFQAAMRRDVPAQRLGTGTEAAAVVSFLASPDASYLFGAVIPLDGGWSLA